MNKKKWMLSAAMAALAAFSPAVSLAGSTSDAGTPCACERAARRVYERGGLRLSIPEAYDRLVVTDILGEREGTLFSVSEKASIAAAKKLSQDVRGAGWLFAIGRVDEGRRRELLCGDMSGAEIFARDANGQCYVYYHPTDVRYMREDNAAMKRDQAQWTMLGEWAWNNVRDEFRRDNGLEAAAYDNSAVGMAIARAAYQSGARYTVSTTEFGHMEAKNFDAAPFAEKLVQNATYERLAGAEAPDGEYVVLAFPGEGLRYDFFKMTGKENYVREVRQDGTETLYKATFADGATKASAVMQAWYDALVAEKGK